MDVDRIEAAGLVISILIVTIFCLFITWNVFPAFKYAVSNENLIEVSEQIGRETSRFMWSYRSIDLIAQALVLFGTAAGCLAILRREEKDEVKE